MRLNTLVRTALFRLTLIYIAVFMGAALVLVVGGAYAASLYLEYSVRNDVEAELRALMETFDANDGYGLVDEVEARLAGGAEEGFDYLLQDPTGVALAGTLPPMDPVEGWLTLVVPEGEEDEPAIALGVFFPNGEYLVIAGEAEIIYEARDFMLDSLGWGLGLALPLVVGAGLAASFFTLRRIEAINRATAKIRRGDLAERVPVGHVDDEFNRLALNINAMLDGIEELTESIRQVTNDVAHDLRTPLTRLRQDLERAQEDPQGEDPPALIDRSIAQIDEILATFSSLLRISQIESGSGKGRFQPIDLSALFRDLCEIFETVAEDSDKTLSSDIADGLTISGEKNLLRQMLVNLIENAIQHTPAGTRITVQLARFGGDTYAVIAGDGPGVPDEARDKIFGRFFRLDESRKTPGNGLGLSLVAAIAKYHGIALQVSDNRPGLRISISFPHPNRNGRDSASRG